MFFISALRVSTRSLPADGLGAPCSAAPAREPTRDRRQIGSASYESQVGPGPC